MNTNKHYDILDCTLRDGAYLVDKYFGTNNIHGIIKGLVNAKTDIIEIGFLQNDGFGDGKTVFRNSADAEQYIPSDKGNTIFTVLADYSRYSAENLDFCNGKGIDAVRECFFKKERYDAIKVCKHIKEKGYKVFIQPVDILGYTDAEIIELIDMVNEIEPFCFSIVDTFGSMFHEDLNRLFELINHNLNERCRIGFHSHNNMQLSNALSQEFVRMSLGKRKCIIDTTLSGMGRGAGNTPTELIMHYLNSKWNGTYDIDCVLDLLDSYMDNIRSKCSWGYSVPYFIAGCYNAHVNNINFLLNKNAIRSKDIRFILNCVGDEARKRYDYDKLEQTYIDFMSSDIDDTDVLNQLRSETSGKKILMLVPGKSLKEQEYKINSYIKEYNPLVIAINLITDIFPIDYVYINNKKRFFYWKDDPRFISVNKILTSNFCNTDIDNNTKVVSYIKLAKCGSKTTDNSAIMLLRLLDILSINDIAIAGFDGYSINGTQDNYMDKNMEIQSVTEDPLMLNSLIFEMLRNFWTTKQTKDMTIEFVTESRFEAAFE